MGGISLFPAPLGTLLGTVVGYSGFPILNAAASFAIILLVGLIARELDGQPLVAQALALVIARGDWFRSWGMDSTAIALLLTAALLHFRGRSESGHCLRVPGSSDTSCGTPARPRRGRHERLSTRKRLGGGTRTGSVRCRNRVRHRLSSRLPAPARAACFRGGGTRAGPRLLASSSTRLRRNISSTGDGLLRRLRARCNPCGRSSRFRSPARLDALRRSLCLHRGRRRELARLAGANEGGIARHAGRGAGTQPVVAQRPASILPGRPRPGLPRSPDARRRSAPQCPARGNCVPPWTIRA